jgi:hypothetical protein
VALVSRRAEVALRPLIPAALDRRISSRQRVAIWRRIHCGPGPKAKVGFDAVSMKRPVHATFIWLMVF